MVYTVSLMIAQLQLLWLSHFPEKRKTKYILLFSACTDLTGLFIGIFPMYQNWLAGRQEDYLSSEVVLRVSKAARVGTPGQLRWDVSEQELTRSFVWGVCLTW